MPFRGSSQLLLQVQEFRALSAVSGLQAQSFISKDARIPPGSHRLISAVHLENSLDLCHGSLWLQPGHGGDVLQ